MARKKKKPTYWHHKPSGRGRARIDGKDVYFSGPFGSPKSIAEYHAHVGRWLAEHQDTSEPNLAVLTIDDLVLLFLDHARHHYRKGGVETSEVGCIVQATRRLIRLYGESLASQFGPKALRHVRDEMIKDGLVRSSINIHIGRIRRMFKWAVSEELLPIETYQRLTTLTGLQEGRSAAKESTPVRPVPQPFIDAVQPFVSRQVWAIIQLQLATGARPGEILSMRGCDLNRTAEIWEYTPASHKTQHRKKTRVIFLGPRAQAIAQEFLKGDPTAYLFSPRDAKEDFFRLRREKRTTPMTPSQRARRRKAKPKKQPGRRYTVCSLGQAIRLACMKADSKAHKEQLEIPASETLIQQWRPNQLRHNAATELRRQFGIEATRTILGHASTVTTEIYAEADRLKARDIMAMVG